MKILKLARGCKPEVLEIADTLEAMQQIVGGSIQILYPYEDEVALVCHDEGKLLNLPFNRVLRDNETKEILKHAKTGYHGGRYTCINLQNVGTIEFRMFRGTLKYNTFIATLQLVDKICELAVNLSDEEIKNMPWTTFAGECRKKELVQYLKERNLYINEPVESEEEL